MQPRKRPKRDYNLVKIACKHLQVGVTGQLALVLVEAGKLEGRLDLPLTLR
jgi:hypothetical protein